LRGVTKGREEYASKKIKWLSTNETVAKKKRGNGKGEKRRQKGVENKTVGFFRWGAEFN